MKRMDYYKVAFYFFVFCELFEEVVSDDLSPAFAGAWMPVADDQNFHVSG